MAERTRRVIEIDVTTSPTARRGIREINSQLRKIEGSAKKTQREVARMSRGFNVLSIAAKAFIAIRMAKAVTDTSDSMILLGARINIVTEETVGVEQAFSDLFEIASKTRQSIESTGTLYARLGFATKSLNLDHQELLDIVQGVNNTLLLSGASAQEAASSIIQLSQAFSKGSLDGDEFRSVSEGNVILFGIMQEVLGKTARELRQFSRDGLLSAEIMAQVITSQQVKDLQTRVDEIPFTFAQAFNLVTNELSKLARYFEDTFSDITEAIVDTLADLNTLVRFIGAVSSGVIEFDLSKMFKLEFSGDPLDILKGDIYKLTFDTKAMLEQLERATPILKAIEHDAATGATIFRDAIKLLNVEFNESIQKEEQLRQTLRNLGDAPFPVDETLNRVNQQLIAQIDHTDKLTIAINANNAAINVQEEGYAQLRAEQERVRKLGDTALEGLPTKDQQTEMDKLTAAMRNADEIVMELLLDIDDLVSVGLSDETATRARTKAWEDYDKAMEKAIPKLSEAEKRSKELAVAIGNTLANGIGSATDSLYDFITGLESSFGEAINNIINDIGRLMLKLYLLHALESSLAGSPVGSIIFPSEKGNVFTGGQITPFATGGVIDQPTFFPMNNGIGLLGEAGPEAILPLKRGTGGELGVSVEGGKASAVSVSIENKGERESRIVESSATTDINGTVVNIVLDDLRRGGPIRDTVKSMREYG